MHTPQRRSSLLERLRLRRAFIAFFVLCSLPLPASPLSQTEQKPAATGVPAPAALYRLQPGDTISVFYRLTPEYNQSLTVLPDGFVSLRLVGSVHVAGLDTEQARQAITTEAGKRLRDPEVSVSVVEFVREQFTVMGEVGRPGRYELRGPTSIVDGLALASGFTSLSAQKKVVLVRPLGPASEYGNATIFDFKQLTHRKASTPVPVLQSGDIVIVTTSKFAKITGIIRLLNVGLYYNPVSAFS